MQIPQESLVLVSSRVTSHSISGISWDTQSFLSDDSGNLLNMILDSEAEEHNGFWTVRSLGRHDEKFQWCERSKFVCFEETEMSGCQ